MLYVPTEIAENRAPMTKLSVSPSAATQTPSGSGNPLLEAWQTPFETPPFERILPEHFPPAYTAAFAEHDAEIAAVKADAAPHRCRVQRPCRRQFDAGTARDRKRDRAGRSAALESDHDGRAALRPTGEAARECRGTEAHPGAGAGAGTDLPRFPPLRRRPERDRQGPDGGHQRATGPSRHHLQP